MMCTQFQLCAKENELPQDIREKLFSCGYNSLYLFLKLKGHNPDFETLKSHVAVSKNGTSLYDLQSGAAALGVSTDSVRCSYETLCSANMPVIAWINKNPKKKALQELVIGHFIVLTNANDDGVEYLDGTSGQKSTFKKSNFLKKWNGMILIEKKAVPSFFNKVVFFLFLIGVAMVLLRFGLSKKTAATLVGLILCSADLCQANDSTRIWRTHENETINAAYLLLQSNSIQCDYATIETELKTSSATQSLDIIKNYLQYHGLGIDIFQCPTPEALKRIPIPFLIHVENGNNSIDSQWNGNFLLVIGRGYDHYMVLDCGTIIVSEIPEEILRRFWSGYVLGKLPKVKQSFLYSSSFFSLLTGIAVLLIYLGFTSKTKSQVLKSLVAFIFFLLIAPDVSAQCVSLPAIYSPKQIKETLLNTANRLESIKVHYRSEYYTNAEAPPKSYLYRKILAKSPYYLNHTNSHPCDFFTWDKDPMLQQAFIQRDIGYNIFPFRNNYFVMTHKSNDPLPGTLPEEVFFNATGIWPMSERKTPFWGKIPVVLRDVAKNDNYSQVRPTQEIIDGHWCHVLYWDNHDTLRLDMERGAVLLAREVIHDETGTLAFRYDLSAHVETAPGIWIPTKFRNIQFDFAAQTTEGQKRRVIDGFFEVTEVEVNTLTESDFVFTPMPGALLTYDAREPNAKYPYQSVPGGEEMLDRIANWVRNMYPPRKVSSKTDWGWSMGVVVVPVIIFLEIRRRKQHASR